MRFHEVIETRKIIVYKARVPFDPDKPWAVWYFPTNGMGRRTVACYPTWKQAMEFADFMANGGALKGRK